MILVRVCVCTRMDDCNNEVLLLRGGVGLIMEELNRYTSWIRPFRHILFVLLTANALFTFII